jgi:hypothetical protein
MKKNHLIAIIIILAFTLFVVLAHSGASDKADKAIEKAELKEKTYLPTESNPFKESYLEGCVGKDLETFNYCDCTYDVLVRELGEKKLLEQAVDFVYDDILSPEFEKATSKALFECFKYIE